MDFAVETRALILQRDFERLLGLDEASHLVAFFAESARDGLTDVCRAVLRARDDGLDDLRFVLGGFRQFRHRGVHGRRLLVAEQRQFGHVLGQGRRAVVVQREILRLVRQGPLRRAADHAEDVEPDVTACGGDRLET